MKTILAIAVVCVSASAWCDDQAPVTFSGKGKSPIEVKDASGKVVEVLGASKLQLNQIPAGAVAREETFRAKQKEVAVGANARRAENAATEQKTAASAADAQKKADAQAIAAAAADAKKQKDEHPEKVRRTTVRGNRYVPKPDSAADANPVPAAPPPGPRSESSPK